MLGWNDETWGYWGDEPPCHHLVELAQFIEDVGIEVYSEHGEGPSGWVNVHCDTCSRTYETILRLKDAEDEEDED